MKYFLLPLLFTFFLKADTDSVDTSNFDWNLIIPMEFSYINTKDDGTLQHAGVGLGVSLEYDLFEVQISGMFIPYTDSDTLFNWNDETDIADTIKYGGTLLYKLNHHWQIGIDYSKYMVLTNKGQYKGGTTYGRMSSYGLKVLYDPLADINSKKIGSLLMVVSLGYLDSPNITYEEKIKDYNIARREWEIQHIKKKYDLSGPMITLGLLKKF